MGVTSFFTVWPTYASVATRWAVRAVRAQVTRRKTAPHAGGTRNRPQCLGYPRRVGRTQVPKYITYNVKEIRSGIFF